MTGGLGIWAFGICASALANAAIGTALLVAMRPEPVDQQETPQTELDVQAYQFNRDRAVEQSPKSDIANAAKPNSPLVDPGTVPQSQAVANLPEPARLTAQPPLQGQLEAAPPASPIQVPTDADAISLGSTKPPENKLSGEALPARAAPAVQAVSLIAPQAAVPDDVRLPTVAAAATALNSADHSAMVLPQAHDNAAALSPEPPQHQSTTPTPTEPERMTAALAFSGSGDGEIDPASLAAFQSFVHPDDAPAQGARVRDALSNLLAQIPCSRLQVEFDPGSATLRVKGHVPEDGLRAPVLTALRQQMGADISLSDDIRILPRPQCGALTGISEVGLPQSTDQITNPLLVGADTHVRALDFVRDDRLYFDLTAPDYDAYVYVDYFDADGNVLHLSPNDQITQRLIPANSVFQVGARTPDDTGLQIFIGPPFGQEISAAFAASAPLYDTPRPLIEPAAAYLSWLKERVALTRATDPEFKGEWVYFFVTTSAE